MFQMNLFHELIGFPEWVQSLIFLKKSGSGWVILNICTISRCPPLQIITSSTYHPSSILPHSLSQRDQFYIDYTDIEPPLSVHFELQVLKHSIHSTNKNIKCHQSHRIHSLHVSSSTPQILHNLQMTISTSCENRSQVDLSIQNHIILTIHQTYPFLYSIPAPSSSTNLFTSSKSPFSQAS